MEEDGNLFITYKKVKAGILLYALILSVIFGLFLQFFLQEQISTYKHLLKEKDQLTAQLMAVLTQQNDGISEDKVQFSSGFVLKKSTDKSVSGKTYDVHLNDGNIFSILPSK